MATDWLVPEYNPQDIEDLASFTGLNPAICLERLQSYDINAMAEAWQRANPVTPDEIRRFYESTDLYLWELTKWHNSTGYATYLALLDTLIARFPPDRYPRVLDYGSGIGTAALRLAEAGYHVTLADVPGKTLAYAESRFHRRGYPCDVIRVAYDRPRLPGSYDLFVCFDVLEHIPKPDRLIRHLAASLRTGAMAAIVATFVTYDSHPHHLVENSEHVAPLWPLSLRLAGLDRIDKDLYRKASRSKVWLRRARFRFWQATGLYLLHTRDPHYLQKVVT